MVESPIFNNENNTINKIDRGNNKFIIISMTKKNKNLAKTKIIKSIKLSSSLEFLILKAWFTFILWKSVFIKTPILHFFNLEYYI